MTVLIIILINLASSSSYRYADHRPYGNNSDCEIHVRHVQGSEGSRTGATAKPTGLTAQNIAEEQSQRFAHERIAIAVVSAGGGSLIIATVILVVRRYRKQYKARKALRNAHQERLQMHTIMADRDRGIFDGSGKRATFKKKPCEDCGQIAYRTLLPRLQLLKAPHCTDDEKLTLLLQMSRRPTRDSRHKTARDSQTSGKFIQLQLAALASTVEYQSETAKRTIGQLYIVMLDSPLCLQNRRTLDPES